MYLIGITGLIGSGKTTIGNILKSSGYVVYDMDQWCRKMYFNPEFLSIIRQNYPQTFYNNKFDKKILRKIVFSDKKQLQKLEALTHPYLISLLKKTIHHYQKSKYIFFFESALLYQMGLDKYCTYIIQTSAPNDVMQKRVMKRDLIDEGEYLNIIDNQKSFEKYDKKADFVIDTNKTLGIIKTELLNILKRIESA